MTITDEFTNFEPGRGCALCPRLNQFLIENAQKFPEFHNAPVPDLVPPDMALPPELLIVGLAPGLRGANRTGVPFTGDHAGEMLMRKLSAFGFSTLNLTNRPRLSNCIVTNAVRCVPPDNRPTPQEVKTCNTFLSARIASMSNLKVILAIGRTAHEAVVRSFQQPLRLFPFAHGSNHSLQTIRLISSYHCSRYNFNTGVLTERMLEAVLEQVQNCIQK